MIKKTSKAIISIIVIGILAPSFLLSQGGDEGFRARLETILTKFTNYRFSEVSVYQIKDMKDIRAAIKTKEEAETMEQVVNEDCIKNGDRAILNFVESEVRNGSSVAEVTRNMLQRGMPIPADLDCIYNYYASRTVVQRQLRTAYAVTTKMYPGQIEPNVIIALIVSENDEAFIDKNIGNPSPTNIYTYPELKNFELKEADFRANNMYDLVINAFRQNNIINKTLEAQGIGTFLRFAPKKYGVSNSLVSDKFEIKGTDIEKFLRVTEGQPNDMSARKNEIIAGPDLIRWTRYAFDIENYEDGTSDTISLIANTQLPKFGLEMKYGVEEINYPSLWSERITLSALWDAAKLGIILPTSGWSAMTNNVFSVTRKLTYAGVGVAGKLDFPILILPGTGIFHIEGGYVFGDAEPSDYKNRNTDPIVYKYTAGDDDWLIRGNGTLFYTFGIDVDENYMFRFGVGASIYSAETWNYQSEMDSITRLKTVNYKKAKSETIGGIATRLDFMAKGLTTPFGASIQFFDESLFGKVWLQIPVVENRLFIRLDANAYFKVFASAPRVWENKSFFLPMARVIINF